MKKDIKIAVIGGDTRQLVTAHELARDGFRVNCFGTPKNDGRYKGFNICNSLEDAVGGCDAVILGVPCSQDGKWLNCPPDDYAISVKGLLDAMCPGQLLLGGRISAAVYTMADKYCIKALDYFDSEDLAIKNAVPTAEGAMEIAMKELDMTLCSAKALILGYGRVGKVLAHTLSKNCSSVTVSCRRASQEVWCRVYGYDFCPLDKIGNSIEDYDVIFNTIPATVLTKELLEKTSGVIIDLASVPGGVDMGAAAELGNKVIWALSLPGKVAPVTAGMIIKDSVIGILTEEGIL